MIRELLERQDYLETRLAKMEAVLLFDDEDLEAQSGVKREEDEDGNSKKVDDELITVDSMAQASGSAESQKHQEEDNYQVLMQSEAEKFEAKLLQVDEEYREIYKEAMTYADQLKQEIFEPSTDWTKWQETKNYKIEVSSSIPSLKCFCRRGCPTQASWSVTQTPPLTHLLTTSLSKWRTIATDIIGIRTSRRE